MAYTLTHWSFQSAGSVTKVCNLGRLHSDIDFLSLGFMAFPMTEERLKVFSRIVIVHDQGITNVK